MNANASTSRSPLTVLLADLRDPVQADGLRRILDDYAREPSISCQPLSEELLAALPQRIAEQPGSQVLLARIGEEFVGAAVCFTGFSTFAGKPLLNIHDLAVRSEFRSRGIGRALLTAVANRARELGCCRVTLEVLPDNTGARRLYESADFHMTQEFWRRDL